MLVKISFFCDSRALCIYAWEHWLAGKAAFFGKGSYAVLHCCIFGMYT